MACGYSVVSFFLSVQRPEYSLNYNKLDLNAELLKVSAVGWISCCSAIIDSRKGWRHASDRWAKQRWPIAIGFKMPERNDFVKRLIVLFKHIRDNFVFLNSAYTLFTNFFIFFVPFLAAVAIRWAACWDWCNRAECGFIFLSTKIKWLSSNK